MQLVGKQMISFRDNNGQMIEGIKLHFTGADDRVMGQAALTQFIRKEHPCYNAALQLEMGEFDILYGRNNSIQKIIQG